jgi:lipid-A-disaccharide synthase
MTSTTRRLRIGVIAGERSGDALGAGLIRAVRSRVPNAEFFGIAGDAMIAAGCEPWYHAEELAVMGLAEVLRHLPRLVRRLEASAPDVFVGIDSPDFNLPVAAALHRRGIRTVQYVSPQVWAWRQSRVAGIRAAVDLVLCVLPFEADFYASHRVKAIFVGHPLADQVPAQIDAGAARAALDLPLGPSWLAVLPGSRRSEVSRLARPFAETALWLAQQRPDLECVVALANPGLRDLFLSQTQGLAFDRPPRLIVGRTREVLAAADAVLTASGTASLEAALMQRPMVVAYRVSWLTYWMVQRLGLSKLRHFSLPNLLAGRELVPEFVQSQVRAPVLGAALLQVMNRSRQSSDWRADIASIHASLRRDADRLAAEAIIELAGST